MCVFIPEGGCRLSLIMILLLMSVCAFDTGAVATVYKKHGTFCVCDCVSVCVSLSVSVRITTTPILVWMVTLPAMTQAKDVSNC